MTRRERLGCLVPFLTFPLLLLGGCWFWEVKIHGLPRETKLADCTKDSLRFPLRCPSGSRFQLLLGVPEKPVDWDRPNAKPNQPPTFEGKVAFWQEGRIVHRIVISSRNARSCNWLKKYSLDGAYLLTWDAPDDLEKHLTPGRSYDVRVSFTHRPAPTTSLWLSWLTSYKQA